MDFGDGYTRNGLEAFSADAALQCMPLDVSPLVVYFNPRLIELDQIAEPGANAGDPGGRLVARGVRLAAQQPRRPGVRGFYIAPDLEQVAPFVWSGGGEVVDDADEPTTLTLSDGPSAGAMEQLLELVRDPALTFSQSALRKRSALERFKAGKLGMILGYRGLTPELRARARPDLRRDAAAEAGQRAPRSPRCRACASPRRPSETERAADFLAEVISDEGASTLAATGYVMPANLDVRQRRRLPADRAAPAARRRLRPRGARHPAAAQHAAVARGRRRPPRDS